MRMRKNGVLKMTEEKTKSLRNCKKCGRLFSGEGNNYLCSRCNEDIDDGFTKVRTYIYDNPTSSVKEVSAGTGVPVDDILKWIREEKIILSSNSAIGICERCGDATDGSRFCNKCVKELSQGLSKGLEDAASTLTKSPRVGMHIKDKK